MGRNRVPPYELYLVRTEWERMERGLTVLPGISFRGLFPPVRRIECVAQRRYARSTRSGNIRGLPIGSDLQQYRKFDDSPCRP